MSQYSIPILQVDIKYTQPSTGGYYFPQHMPVLGKSVPVDAIYIQSVVILMLVTINWLRSCVAHRVIFL